MIYVRKREEAPASLAIEKAKANGNYNQPDVHTALKEDAFNKCYLCEDWAPTSINIEHFEEHRGDKDKKFDWKNLFYSCQHCNGSKAAMFPRTVASSNLLNCTKIECKVDLWIIHRLITDTSLKHSVQVLQNENVSVSPFETQTENTVNLLHRIFNGSNNEEKSPGMNSGAENLRIKVAKEIKAFKSKVLSYRMAHTSEEKQTQKESIMDDLKKESPFLSFKHWLLRDYKIQAEFGIE